VQAAALPATICLLLLSALDTGASEHIALQAAADRLLATCCGRTRELLAADLATRADAGVRGKLLQFLGPLQDMLNDKRRRDLFGGLPFDIMRVRAPCQLNLLQCALMPCVRWRQTRWRLPCQALPRMRLLVVSELCCHLQNTFEDANVNADTEATGWLACCRDGASALPCIPMNCLLNGHADTG
jgi:hypothetical protein